jgi:hypothetical protein
MFKDQFKTPDNEKKVKSSDSTSCQLLNWMKILIYCLIREETAKRFEIKIKDCY